jgi:hypothetical protein
VILYYALGGGLGHITRARRVLAALGCMDRAMLLTASPFARDSRVTGGLPVLHVPVRLGRDRAAFALWLRGALALLRPEELIVDTFPGGITGELCGMPLPPARHIARRLRWGAYALRLHGPLPRYELAHVLEPLSEPHEWALAQCAAGIGSLELAAHPAASVGEPLCDQPHWLVVHSGPDAETAELAAHACEVRAAATSTARIVVVCPRCPPDLPRSAEWRDTYPVAPHLPHAERIFTAAGFNLMLETAPLRDRHRFIPFPRPLDDQYARAAGAMRHLPPSGPPPSVTLRA